MDNCVLWGMMMTKRTPAVPAYFKDLPDNANLNSRDVAAIFGYSQLSNMLTDMRDGKIPHHELALKCGSVNAFSKKQHGIRHVFWKVKTIREWIENVNNKPTK